MKFTLKWFVVALLLTNSLVADTVLIFEPSDEMMLVPDSYGDRVTSSIDVFGNRYAAGSGGTSNVMVEYGPPGSHVRQAPGPYGGLDNVACQEDGDFGVLEVRLTADPGFNVVLRGFDLAMQGYDAFLARVEVLGDNGVNLHVRDNVFVPGFLGMSRRFDFAKIPLVAPTVLIRIDLSTLDNTDSHLVGIDNIAFSQVSSCPRAPGLTITRSGNSVIVSWPGSGYRLETATAISGQASNVWSAVAGTSPVTLSSRNGAQFFRLVCP